MVSFTHQDAGTGEDTWAASGLAALPELPLDAGELAGQAFIVLAAHPDDESLGAGGLMARLRGLGARVTVLLCTAGEASHPDSPTTTPEQLAAVRLKEFGGALAHLLPDPDWRFLALPDGRLADHTPELHAALQRAIADAAASGLPAERITLVAPYRHDGHTDHEALGAAAAEAAGAGGHGLLEYPIWYWLWADAADQAWQSWLRLPLDPAERRAKAAAMASHASQVRPLSGQPGDEVLLPPAFLEHFERPFETFAWQRPAARQQWLLRRRRRGRRLRRRPHRHRRPLAVHHQLVRTPQTRPHPRGPARPELRGRTGNRLLDRDAQRGTRPALRQLHGRRREQRRAGPRRPAPRTPARRPGPATSPSRRTGRTAGST